MRQYTFGGATHHQPGDPTQTSRPDHHYVDAFRGNSIEDSLCRVAFDDDRLVISEYFR